MTTITAEVSDTLLAHAKKVAEREKISLDQLVSLALTGQIASLDAGVQFKSHSKRGSWDRAREILRNAPDVEPEENDRI